MATTMDTEQVLPGEAAPLIVCRGLTKTFKTADGQLPVLENIDLEVLDGEILALLGKSGSGKSTLLRCIAGLIAPSSGTVTFRGKTANGVRFLEIITNFVWVYPFAGALQKPGDHLVIVHDEVTWEIPVDADVDKNHRGLHINGWNGYASNMDCDLLKKSLLALGKPRLALAGAGEDNKADFDPSRSVDIASTC